MARVSLESRARRLVRVVEFVTGKTTTRVCVLDPELVPDCLRAVLRPLHWTLPCVDRVPKDIGHDLVSGVSPARRLPVKRGDGAGAEPVL